MIAHTKKEYYAKVDRYQYNQQNKIVRYFKDVSMQNGHDGLRVIAQNEDVDVTKLSPGEYVIFVNKAKNKLKMFTAGQCLVYLRVPGRLDLKVISLIPRFFNGKTIDYSAALAKSLREDLGIVQHEI